MMKIGNKKIIDLLRFLAGLVILGSLVAFFSSGYTPPGICGEVIRHNQEKNIDAPPFFYGDVENMLEIIESMEQLHFQAGLNQRIEKFRP